MEKTFKIGDKVRSRQWLVTGNIVALQKCPHKNCSEVSIILHNDRSSRYHLSSFELVED